MLARLALIALVLTACQAVQPLPSSPAPAPSPTPHTSNSTESPDAATFTASGVEPADAGGPNAGAAVETVVPERLAIPAIGLDVAVAPMGWEIIGSDGARSTRWQLPDDAAGWHVNSALPGEPGVALISGSQLAGEAVFAALALGEVKPGLQVDVTLSDGSHAFYVVDAVSKPIPLRGASVEEQARVAEYLAAGAAPRLVLITGWPDFTTTHRLFVVAELAEEPSSP